MTISKNYINLFKSYAIYIYFLFLANHVLISQDRREIDSLDKTLATIRIDSIKIQTLNILAVEIVDIDPLKSIKYATEALKLAETTKSKKGQAKALHNIGNGHYNLAEYKVALSYYIKSLNIQESIGNKVGILASSGAIGTVFIELKQNDEAFKYLNRAFDISKELNNKGGMASALISIGIVFSQKKDYKQSLEYTFQALKIFEELDLQDAAATCLNNIADSYQKLRDSKKAIFYITKAYDIYFKNENTYGIALTLNNLGDFYELEKNYSKANEYYQKGLAEAKKIGANDRVLAAYKGIYKSNKELGNFKEALIANELYQNMNDSIYNIESSKQIAEMQTRFDTEKKTKEIDILTKDQKIKEDELNKHRLITLSISIGGVLIFLLALLAIRGYIQKRRVSNQLTIKNEKIETAYTIIENHNKDIKDSIKYAKRLQEAILPTTKFNNIFKENAFVLYKPKDIVSGDFYWIEEATENGDQVLLFAAVDCTGHGVPGAFMSIVGHNLLKQAVNEHHKTKPSDILNELNIGVNETLRQTLEESTVKDGMDISLCSLKKNTSNSYILQFAGANNPLWIIRKKDKYELEEIKGDKFPIGAFVGEELNKFSNHEVELFTGDTLYIFTDGFADQFGGPKGKKFMYKSFKQILLSNQHLSMKEQREEFNKILNNWKGELEQIDDVLVIGIKI
jgi:serine phosphatase RsbU (regulator of sigma subunit)